MGRTVHVNVFVPPYDVKNRGVDNPKTPPLTCTFVKIEPQVSLLG